MPLLYPIRAAAKLTGLPIDTLRAWERRYHAVTPDRTARGRLYSDAEIRRLVLLRTAVDNGHAIGQVAQLSDEELQNLARISAPPTEHRRLESGPHSAGINLQTVLDAVAAFDYGATNEELSRLALLLSPSALVHQVVLPLMRIAGENWEKGISQIAQEHMFSACLRNLLGGLIRLQRPSHNSARLLFTTPANEQHEFGILAAAMLAVARDFHVTYLGPNLPAVEIVSASERCGAGVVVLGIMKVNATPAVHSELRSLTATLPPATELWAGGSGASEMMAGIHREGVDN